MINDNNIEYGTDGGNDTKDKVFLLAESDVWNTDKAVSHGFSKAYNDYDKARRSYSTTYAKAMGTYSRTDYVYAGNCYWWLRSPRPWSGGIVRDVTPSGALDGYLANHGHAVAAACVIY